MAVVPYGLMSDDVISPELALVDPDGSCRADVVDAVIAAALRPPRPVPSLVIVTGYGSRARSSSVVETARRRVAASTARQKLVAGAAAATAAAATLVLATQHAQRAASTEAMWSSSVPAPTSPNRGPAQRSQEPQAETQRTTTEVAAPRRLAWAPVAGALGYQVEIFSGDKRILSRRTLSPMLEVPRTWASSGGTNSLTPGEYRWYVWSVGDAGRSSVAIVQATLVVPDHGT